MNMEMGIGWMNRSFRHGCSRMLSFLLALCMGVSIPPLRAGDERVAASEGKPHPAAAYGDPIQTYGTFMDAIKRDDLAAAEACCRIADDNKSGSLDVLVGMWVAFHHFNKVALEHFKDDVRPYLEVGGADQKDNPYLRRDCTDQALERTIYRLPGSKFRIKGDKAWLKIKWGDKDYDDLNIVRRLAAGILLERPELSRASAAGHARPVPEPGVEFVAGALGEGFRIGVRVQHRAHGGAGATEQGGEGFAPV